MGYQKKTKEERQEEIKQAQADLTAKLESLVTSEDWLGWLNYQAKFHKYSANNCMMIIMQRPDATMVAGYDRWQELGRQVRKGEKGIRIWAPMKHRAEVEDAQTGEKSERRWTTFFLVSVFDVSQTDGDPIPERCMPTLLEGEAPQGLYDSLAAQVTAAGYTLQRGDCEGANGWTNYASRVVRVRDDVSEAQACKTLAHELGHILLDHEHRGHLSPEGKGEITITRDRMEVEAESVAYVVCSAQGLDSTGYTLGYVATWADGSLAKVRETTSKVADVAKRILETIDAATPALAEVAA